jgi:hypothetical protein
VTITPAINDSSAPDSPGVSPADLLKQIAVFRYCEEVLQDRSAAGSRAWLWQVKRKVATYCRKTLEGRADMDPSPYAVDLSDIERQQLLRSHPLLSDAPPGDADRHVCPEWLIGLRTRVARFIAHLRQSHGDEP